MQRYTEVDRRKDLDSKGQIARKIYRQAEIDRDKNTRENIYSQTDRQTEI